jgi:hypothetical protein
LDIGTLLKKICRLSKSDRDFISKSKVLDQDKTITIELPSYRDVCTKIFDLSYSLEICSQANLIISENKINNVFALSYIFAHFGHKVGDITINMHRNADYLKLIEAVKDCQFQPKTLILRNDFDGS